MYNDYNSQGLPERVTDANGLATLFAYDLQGRLIKRQTGGRVAQYRYAPAGALTAVVLPDGSSEQRSYDLAGNLAGQGEHRLGRDRGLGR